MSLNFKYLCIILLLCWWFGSLEGILAFFSLVQPNIKLAQKFSLAFGFPISICKTKAIIFADGTTDPSNPLTIFLREMPYCNLVKLLGLWPDSKMQWYGFINSLIIRSLCILKRLAGSKWGCHPKLILGFYKLYIHSNLKYGIQFFLACPLSSIKILESLWNSVIQTGLDVHKHTPLSKFKILSRLVSLRETASDLQIKYFFFFANPGL